MESARRIGMIAAAVALPLGSVTLGSIALASPGWSATQACGLFANTPTGTADGKGGRSGCSGTVGSVTVRVRKDNNNAPDTTLGQTSQTNVVNITLTASGTCSHGAGAYFTETLSSAGHSVQSGRAGLC